MAISRELRDYQARTAHTVLMYLYVGFFIGSLLVSIFVPIFSAPWTPYRIRMSHISPGAAQRATYANAAVDGVMLVYWLVFFVCQHTRRALHVWVQLLAFAVIFGANMGLGITLERAAFEAWYRAAAVVDWMKAGAAIIFAAFLTIYTGVMHGKGGFLREFAPTWREGTPPRLPKDRGAQIAHIVLLSFLLAYTLVAFIMGCTLTSPAWEAKPPENNGLLYVLLGALAIYILYLGFYLYQRHASPQSVLADVIVFPLWAVVLAALAGGVLAVLARDDADMGVTTAYFAFASAVFTLIIVAYEAVYTALHGERGKWRRGFATPPAPQSSDVELAPRASEVKKSHESEESEAAPTLSYA